MSRQNTSLQPYVIGATEGEAVSFLMTHMTLKAGNDSTGGALTMIEVLSPPGGTAPWHVHHREDEMFYVLEGEVLYKCGDEVFQAGPGAFVFLPRDIPHSYKNVGGTNARWLLMTTPAGSEGFFFEVGTPIVGDELRPQPFDPKQLAAIAVKYGLEILGPPPF